MSCKVGQRGAIVIPASIRDRLGIHEGSMVIVEEKEGAVIIRPAVVVPVERYSSLRQAEFLLNNAIDSQDYALACEEVRRMGLRPEDIPHTKP